jgi:hypothetical protein
LATRHACGNREEVYRYSDPVVTQLARGDRLIVVRPAKELPWAPRPGTHNEDTTVDEDCLPSAVFLDVRARPSVLAPALHPSLKPA